MSNSDLSFRTLVTGADGFIGHHLVTEMAKRGLPANCATRRVKHLQGQRSIGVGDIGAHTDWSESLENCQAVVHLAGRAHVLNEEKSAHSAFEQVNAEATKSLVRQAAQRGIKRFLFVSTIAVFDPSLSRLDAQSATTPGTEYGRSKLLAEQYVRDASADMAHTILRVPLVYGPGVGARFLQLLKLASLPVPLPFG
ncbi:MAG TPA: NAD-dependent epimerase/dehydratase family protein, partial [Devosia sp.]|nr:NAD-dependent epimerase/dehydratase family protein [Devosia sp.]